MSTGPGNLFAEFLEDYFAESEEHLASARQNLLTLDARTGSAAETASIASLLRSFHSLKGLSAMVGVNEVTQMSHLMEEYLREVQTSGRTPDLPGLETLMRGVDAMEQVVTARRKGRTVPDFSEIFRSLRLISSKDEGAILQEPEPSTDEAYNWKFSFSPSTELSEQGVNVNVVREKLNRIGTIANSSPRIVDGGGIAFDFLVRSPLNEADIVPLIPPGVTFKASEGPVISPAHSDLSEAPAAPPSSFVRVEMHKLDELMRLIGEMVISRSHFDETIRGLENRLPQGEFRNLQEVNARIERQLRGIREAVMQVRMVPIGQIFERMRFVVRGLERDINKQVHLVIEGHDTQIDKLIVDRMLDPLLHMVRNAVSHGIEKEGTVTISARTSGEKVIIEVADDGRGIDFEHVTASARKAGVIGSNEQVTESNVLEVISSPGFSTREGADLTSGRGVGMAVVHSTIQELGGSLAMHTALGQGTKFTITLPLTLVILDALLVTSDGYRYALPQSGVREIFAIEKTQLKQLENNSLIPYRGGALPVVAVSDLLRFNDAVAVPSPLSKGSRVHVLVIGSDGKAMGLIVDKVTGQREIVVRSISDPSLRIPGVIGATELGDGKPLLIVDAEALVRLDGKRKGQRL